MPKVPQLFPKLFVGDASKSFLHYLHKNHYDYTINSITCRDDLISLIDAYSRYKNYNIPVIISDISFLNKQDQSILLKFMEDTNLKLILLASRDNILGTIISRVREFRKFYIRINNGDQAGFIQPFKAREMMTSDSDFNNINDESSIEDRLSIYNKYNPILSYDDLLVSNFGKSHKDKLLNLLES